MFGLRDTGDDGICRAVSGCLRPACCSRRATLQNESRPAENQMKNDKVYIKNSAAHDSLDGGRSVEGKPIKKRLKHLFILAKHS